MKRLLSVFLILAILISLSGCKLIDKIFKKGQNDPEPAEIQFDINGIHIGNYVIVCDKEGLDY